MKNYISFFGPGRRINFQNPIERKQNWYSHNFSSWLIKSSPKYHNIPIHFNVRHKTLLITLTVHKLFTCNKRAHVRACIFDQHTRDKQPGIKIPINTRALLIGSTSNWTAFVRHGCHYLLIRRTHAHKHTSPHTLTHTHIHRDWGTPTHTDTPTYIYTYTHSLSLTHTHILTRSHTHSLFSIGQWSRVLGCHLAISRVR